MRSDFSPRDASQASNRDTRLRWVAVLTAVGFHAVVVLAISPLFHHAPFLDATPLIVQLLEAPAETEAPGPAAPALETREERKPVATPPTQPALSISRTLPEPRPIAMEEPPPPVVAAQPPAQVPPPVPAPEAPTVAPSPPVASTAISAPVAATATAPAPAGDSAITVSKPSATAASAIGAGSAPKEAVTPPRFDADYLANPAPVFPRDAERDGEEGKVILLVKVGVDGAPLAVDIKTSSGWPRLDQAALAAVRRWRFAPAKLGDKAVIASVLVPLTFSLEN